jgi:hypothetical protein
MRCVRGDGAGDAARRPAELTLGAIAAEAGVTAGALVQRFGSKRELLHAHARYAAATGDIGFGTRRTARSVVTARATCAPSRRCYASWPSHLAPRCGTSPTCTTTWQTRCSAGICCG